MVETPVKAENNDNCPLFRRQAFRRKGFVYQKTQVLVLVAENLIHNCNLNQSPITKGTIQSGLI